MSLQLVKGIVVEDEGDGTPTLCIHGLGGTSNIWTPVLSGFQNCRIVRPDLPGSGRSILPEAPLSIDTYVATLLDVLDTLRLDRVHIAAHSLGTIIAQHLAVEYSGRVLSLALFGPLRAPPDQGRPWIHSRASSARENGVAGMQEIADAIIKGATSEATKAHNPTAVAYVRESVMRQSPEGYARSCEALATAQAAAIEHISVPTLLVTGDEDTVGSPAGVHAMAAQLKNCTVQTLPDCGHWTTLEKPAECTAALKNFYQSIR